MKIRLTAYQVIKIFHVHMKRGVTIPHGLTTIIDITNCKKPTTVEIITNAKAKSQPA